MVEPHTTVITIPTELIQRADRAYEAFRSALVAAADPQGSAERERVLAGKRRELAQLYRELGTHCVIPGGLWRGMCLAAEQLEQQAHDGESFLGAREDTEGGDRA